MSLLQELPLLSRANPADFRNKRVLVRADFNVPLGQNKVVDEFESWRLLKSLRTLQWLRQAEAKTIVISHLGRGNESLLPVANYLNRKFRLSFAHQVFGQVANQIITGLKPGGAVLLENIRTESGETENSQIFAKRLADYADFYIDEAFPAAHREHASIVGLPKILPSFAGFQFEDEVRNLSLVHMPDKPFLVVLGGAKFGTKLELLRQFLDTADYIFVGGALANNFFKAMGYLVGNSLIDDSADITDLIGHEKIVLPKDVIVQDESGVTRTVYPADVKKGDTIYDSGLETMEILETYIKEAQTILWNGPLGYYEGGYDKHTKELARLIAESSAVSIVGGGDTVAAISELELEESFTFMSTAGGAMLDFLADGTLPGVEALLTSKIRDDE